MADVLLRSSTGRGSGAASQGRIKVVPRAETALVALHEPRNPQRFSNSSMWRSRFFQTVSRGRTAWDRGPM